MAAKPEKEKKNTVARGSERGKSPKLLKTRYPNAATVEIGIPTNVIRTIELKHPQLRKRSRRRLEIPS